MHIYCMIVQKIQLLRKPLNEVTEIPNSKRLFQNPYPGCKHPEEHDMPRKSTENTNSLVHIVVIQMLVD